MTLENRCHQIELILSDVDGVLTDGGLIFDNNGIETKKFHIRDGLGIQLWQRAGFQFGILTGRSSQIVRVRATELGLDIIRQGLQDKVSVARQVLEELGLTFSQLCYIGDDLTDLPLLRRVGLSATVADAAPEVREAAHWVAQLDGGRGAVRELIERILQAKNRWADIVARYIDQ